MLKAFLWLVVLSPLIFAGAVFWSAEYSGEVATLITRDPNGRIYTTKLWVVDINGQPMLRSGTPSANWVTRLEKTPTVELERRGRRKMYNAEIEIASRDRANYWMAQKYGYADQILGLIMNRETVIPVLLVDVDD